MCGYEEYILGDSDGADIPLGLGWTARTGDHSGVWEYPVAKIHRLQIRVCSPAPSNEHGANGKIEGFWLLGTEKDLTTFAEREDHTLVPANIKSHPLPPISDPPSPIVTEGGIADLPVAGNILPCNRPITELKRKETIDEPFSSHFDP